MKLKKMNKCYIFTISIFVILNAVILFSTINKKSLKQDYFRIHIVANSNSIADQKLKYAVAENVNYYIDKIMGDKQPKTKSATKEIVQDNIYSILDIAKDTITSINSNYGIIARIGDISYEEKENEEMQMAKGTYDSIELIIGDGNGKNFWSLLYPYSYVGNVDINIYNELENITSKEIISNPNTTYVSGLYEFLLKIFR